MKKSLTIFLAIALIISLPINAFAETYDSRNGDDYKEQTGEVKININSGKTVYYVEVVWESLVFTYNFANSGNWDPEYHTYDGPANVGWDKTSASITVKNHSNAAIEVTASFADGSIEQTIQDPNKKITATLDQTIQNIETADQVPYNNNKDDAPNRTFTVTISGTPNEDTTDFTLGTVYVVISEVTSTP